MVDFIGNQSIGNQMGVILDAYLIDLVTHGAQLDWLIIGIDDHSLFLITDQGLHLVVANRIEGDVTFFQTSCAEQCPQTDVTCSVQSRKPDALCLSNQQV